MLLHSLLARSVERWPDAIAIDVPPGRDRPQRQVVRYAELAALASALSSRVQPFVRGECVVAICLDRTTPWLWAAQVAVLQAGAAFVCLEPGFPDAHKDHVLRDCGAVALVTDAAGAARMAARFASERIVTVPAMPTARTNTNASPPRAPWSSPASLAYVIYTSGTTGGAKGVLLQHDGAVSLVLSGITRFGLGPGDRIAQGSSHAYDSSIEETWLALGSGATVVVVDDETIRRGPDLVPWLRAENVTVLCPPPTLLRAMHCERPAHELPRLRLCYAGGEAMPQDLCDVWARDLWLENGYGPTECTVTVVRGRLQPGEPVTIGTPVPGHRAFLLDEGPDGQLTEVAPDAIGELCIAGPGLARGYLGRDELTATKFVVHPRFGRLYRTGDLARRAADGTLTCLGRIDAQVKVRGHRIELEAIDAALTGCAGVRAAACRVQGEVGDAVLVACVVPTSPEAPPALAAIQEELRRTLPAAMVPTGMVLVGELPRTIGGKLDRRRLPTLPLDAPRPARTNDLNGLDGVNDANDTSRTTTASEATIAAAFAARLPGRPTVGRDDDFFALGGDSLRAAQVITDLRRHDAFAHLTVRDLYSVRTVRGLAAIDAPAGVASTNANAATSDSETHWGLVTVVQIVVLVVASVLASWSAVFVAFEVVPFVVAMIGVVPFVLLGPLLYRLASLLWAIAAVVLAVATKKALIGTYTARSEPVGGWFWLRNWIVQRVAQLVPWRELQGTEFHNMALRALGARIGRRVHLHRGVDVVDGGWDLLAIGDDVMVAQEATLGLVELDRGRIVIGPVRLGAGATLDVRAGTGPNVEVGAGAYVTPLSALPAGSRVPPGERHDGVPARCVGRAPAPPPITVRGAHWSPLAHGCLLLALRVLLGPFSWLAWTLPFVLFAPTFGIDAAAVLQWFEDPGFDERGLATMLALLAAAVPTRLLMQALLLRWSPKAPLGTLDRWSPTYCVVWLRTEALQSASAWLSGSMLWPVWLRLAGMRIGPQGEISTILDVLPEHTAIGARCFLADGIYLGCPRLHAGTVTVATTELGDDTFLGNHVVVPAGQRLPAGLVLGVSTVADDRVMHTNTGWFGQPPFRLPRREVVAMDRRFTYEPSLPRVVERLAWELLRFVLPLVAAVLVGWWFAIVADAVADPNTLRVLVVAPVAALAAATAACAFVLATKWLLLGRVRPGQHALWSSWASRWDFFYVAWGFLARSVLAKLDGTLLQNAFARAMGARVGRRVVVGHGFAQIVDPDMLRIGDGATVNALFQAHSFEDRVLKIDHVHVGAGASIAPGTVVLYGARIGDRATVGMHGIVMKHEHLSPGRHYEGAPVAPAS